MGSTHWLILGYLVVRVLEVAEQAWVNYCTMRVRLGVQKEDRDEDEKTGFR